MSASALMRRLNNSNWRKSYSCPATNCPNAVANRILKRSLSSGEAFTALKPFFFAVHPDLFGQFPKEREVNENSLKRLNEYIESATNTNRQNSPHNVPNRYNGRLTFYLRRSEKRKMALNASHNENINTDLDNDGSFQAVSIDLAQKDIRGTVHTILQKCNLPTSYIDSIPKSASQETSGHARIRYSNPWAGSQDYREQAERDIATKKATQDDLESWLQKNVEDAKVKLREAVPVRAEIVRLRDSLCKKLELKNLVWDCGWGTKHFRGCLESFLSLASHHPDVIEILRGKTVIFGAETGVSLDGDVVLYSGEVQHNWLDVIRNIKKHDNRIIQIPSYQKALSRALKDIKVVHRKFEPMKLAESYEIQLRKLTTSIGDYKGRQNFPTNWPDKLSHLELVVETEAGPLMLSPTGQIICPSSCPPFLLINFITEHMEEASEKLALYQRQKYEEIELHERCMKALGLVKFEKADNVTPNLMIDCCRRLLRDAPALSYLLNGTHLLITTYYSVLTEGEICIPWNWK